MIELTVTGLRFLESAAPQSAAIYAAIEKAFGKGELTELLERLDRLQAAVESIENSGTGT
jgi:DNA-binding MarR family transcriptional regulator